MRARGYTLLELVVALGIAVIGIAAGMTLLIGTQRWFQAGVDDRAMQETARIALRELTVNLRSAGYGMEPTTVFDMGVLQETAMDRLPQIGVVPRFGGYGCPDPGGSCPNLRDRIDGPDELVFYARDPIWAREVRVVGIDHLTLQRPLGGAPTELRPGQVLQVMCYGMANQWLWAYVTVANATPSAGDPELIEVELAPRTAGRELDFPLQNRVLEEPCFGAAAGAPPTGIRAFKIDRYRYHVLAVDPGGNPQPWGTAGARPYLMLDQGLRDDAGNPIDRVVVPDVEDLQVAYMYPLAAGAAVLGATPGAQVIAETDPENGEAEHRFNLNPRAPFVIPSFGTDPRDLDLARTSHHPANIRAVRVAVTVRMARKDELVNDDRAGVVPELLNRPQLDGEDGFIRMVFETTVRTQNLEARVAVFPTYDPQAFDPDNNCLLNDPAQIPPGCTGTCLLAARGNCGGG
ncbi:MAG TPA: type II secretion system protein [Anaeromyxobacter sp.]|nr:type II secretion system protein [Anaeromyxobacter sp.]